MSNKVIFTCELDTCNNIKETTKSLYDKSKKHYCSIKCSSLAKRTANRDFRKTCVRCDAPITEADKCFFNSGKPAKQCAKCRNIKYNNIKKLREKRRTKFVEKWNRIILNK